MKQLFLNKQQKYNHILNVINEHKGFSRVSYRKIAIMLGLKHPQSAIYYLTQLEKGGYIKADWNKKVFVLIKKEVNYKPEIASIPIYSFGTNKDAINEPIKEGEK